MQALHVEVRQSWWYWAATLIFALYPPVPNFCSTRSCCPKLSQQHWKQQCQVHKWVGDHSTSPSACMPAKGLKQPSSHCFQVLWLHQPIPKACLCVLATLSPKPFPEYIKCCFMYLAAVSGAVLAIFTAQKDNVSGSALSLRSCKKLHHGRGPHLTRFISFFCGSKPKTTSNQTLGKHWWIWEAAHPKPWTWLPQQARLTSAVISYAQNFSRCNGSCNSLGMGHADVSVQYHWRERQATAWNLQQIWSKQRSLRVVLECTDKHAINIINGISVSRCAGL